MTANNAATQHTGDAYTLSELRMEAPCCAPTPIIHVRHLSVRYKGVPALSGVNLDIHRGCITALIGPSGCGKTTLLSTMNRLTDLTSGVSVEGDIHFEGRSVRDPSLDVRWLRSQIGMIFQKPNPFPFSIRKNLEMPLREHGVSDATEIASRIETALRDVGLFNEVKDRLNGSALGLSGGQQQRLCIARALVLRPKVLLMDEPCSALDPIASGVVEDLVASLRGQYTVAIVTHNLAQAKRIANYAAFFWTRDHSEHRVGELIEYGDCRQLFEQPNHELTAAYVSGARG